MSLPANDPPFILTLLSALGLSALVGGVTTATINYYMTKREFKRKSQAAFIEHRLEAYSYFIYHLDKMRYTADALRFHYKDTKEQEMYAVRDEDWDETTSAIDEELKHSYHLIRHDILESWIWVKTLKSYQVTIHLLPDLRQKLVSDYNNIVQEHRKVLGVGVATIAQSELLVTADIKSQIIAGEEQVLTIKVKDSENDKKISASVIMEISDTTGRPLKVEQKTTDVNGQLSYSWRTDPSATGEHMISLRISAVNYDSKFISKKYEVKPLP